MNLRINRASFLQVLESVQAGLSPKPIVEQSNSFVFNRGYVITLNGEISCRMKSGLDPSFTGVVTSTPLLNYLKLLNEDEMELIIKDNVFKIQANNKRCKLGMQRDILLPVASVEPPKNWQRLPEDFTEAVTLVHECASDDMTTPVITFLNITPDWIEATDRWQVIRYKLKLPITAPMMIRKSTIKQIVQLDMTEICLTDNWAHFRNPLGLIFSCLRFTERFPSLGEHLKIENATKARLPKGLAEAAKRCEVFSREDTKINRVNITIRGSKILIAGVGMTGDAEEINNLMYDGPDMAFRMAPTMIAEITKKHTDCLISPCALYVCGGKWLYVASLETPQEEKSNGEDQGNPEEAG